jgi:hypothetical protein
MTEPSLIHSNAVPRTRLGMLDLSAGALLVLLFLGLLVASDRITTGSNPDQWFHFAISKMSQAGLVRALPQAEDVGWAHGFPEKEFLFHRMTALAYGLAGERGVLVACRAVSVFSLLLLYALSRRHARPAIAAASIAGLVIANPYLLFRMGMVRPHVLAIFLFLAMLAGLVYRSRLLAFAAATGFALAYHAVYVPAALAAAFAVVGLYRSKALRAADPDLLAPNLVALAGLACGIAANPYFPANVTMGLEHLRYAFSVAASEPGVHVGAEVLPPAPALYLRLFGLSIVALIACIVWLRSDTRAGSPEWDRGIISAAAIFLLGAGLRSVRATEYGIPLLTIAMAAALGNPLRAPRTRSIALAALLLLPAYPLYANLTRPPDRRHQQLVTDLFEAMRLIPGEPRAAKVFDCDWNYGSFLLYARPDLRFVDLLDPRFLLVNPERFEAKRLLDLDQWSDPVGAMRVLFKADYALCANPVLGGHLERDNRVSVLYSGRSGLRLYALQAAVSSDRAARR